MLLAAHSTKWETGYTGKTKNEFAWIRSVQHTGRSRITKTSLLSLLSLPGKMHAKIINRATAGGYLGRFSSRREHYRPNFQSPAHFRVILGVCQSGPHALSTSRKRTTDVKRNF